MSSESKAIGNLGELGQALDSLVIAGAGRTEQSVVMEAVMEGAAPADEMQQQQPIATAPAAVMEDAAAILAATVMPGAYGGAGFKIGPDGVWTRNGLPLVWGTSKFLEGRYRDSAGIWLLAARQQAGQEVILPSHVYSLELDSKLVGNGQRQVVSFPGLSPVIYARLLCDKCGYAESGWKMSVKDILGLQKAGDRRTRACPTCVAANPLSGGRVHTKSSAARFAMRYVGIADKAHDGGVMPEQLANAAMLPLHCALDIPVLWASFHGTPRCTPVQDAQCVNDAQARAVSAAARHRRDNPTDPIHWVDLAELVKAYGLNKANGRYLRPGDGLGGDRMMPAGVSSVVMIGRQWAGWLDIVAAKATAEHYREVGICCDPWQLTELSRPVVDGIAVAEVAAPKATALRNDAGLLGDGGIDLLLG